MTLWTESIFLRDVNHLLKHFIHDAAAAAAVLEILINLLCLPTCDGI